MIKNFLCVLGMWLAGSTAVIAFWVWLGTFLLWKILAIVGAGLLIWPAFITMIISGVLVIVLMFIAAVIRE